MKIIKLVLISISLVILTFASANYAGICIKKASWLNNEELINIAIERTIQRQNNKTFHTDGTVTVDNPIPYKSINEFLVANPKCCIASRDLDTPEGTMPAPFIDKITGHFHKFVKVNYTKRYNIENEIIEIPAYKIYRVKNCGALY